MTMATMLYLTVTSLKLVFVIIISCASGQTRNDGPVSLLCNDQLVYGYTHDPYHCHLISPHPMTWRDAHTFCRSRGGWLQKCVSCDQEEGSDTAVNARLLIENDVHSLWTGFYVRDYRLLQDQYPIPERPQTHNVFYGEWVESSKAQGTCIREYLKSDHCPEENGKEDSKSIDQLKDFSNLAAGKKGRAKVLKVCRQVYTREFVSCEEKHNFICLFKGYEAQIEMPRSAPKNESKWINRTDPSTSKMFSRADQSTSKMFSRIDLSTSKMFNQTDSPTLAIFNQTDSPALAIFNQTDSPTLAIFNQTDSPTSSAMFNQTDSTTASVMFNQTDSTTASAMFNQTDSTTTSVMFNQTDSTTTSAMFNQTDSTTTFVMFNQTISTTLGMTHDTISSVLKDKTVDTFETETEINIRTIRNIVSLRISAKMSTFSEADDLCHREKPGSKLFRLQTSANRYFLDKFAGFAAQTIKNSYNIMFWTRSNTHECGAILMRSSQGCNGESLSFTESSWPCDAQLRVVCMSQIDLPETPAPQMEATSIGSEIRVIPGEIQATSRALRYVGGLGTPQSSNEANNTFDRSTRLFIRCNKPADVAARLYKSGLPTPFIAHEGDETEETFGVDLSLWTGESFSYRDIDSAQSYHCEVMNQKDKSLLRSNSIYVRLSDYEIYSVSLALRDINTSAHLSWSLLGISLTNTWEKVFRDQSYGTGQVDKAALQRFMRPLNATVKSLKWMMEPLVFTPERKNSRLVFYIYKPVPGVNVLERDYNTKERLTAFKDTLMEAIKSANLTGFNSTSLTVKSIDWCWAKDVMDQVTNRIYYLPDSSAGAIWKSSQICASDGLPLVTAKCEGDKFIGLDWGPLKVNPLCDYSNITVKESKVTSQLRSLSQGNVTTDNVEFTVRTVKNLVKSVTETDETLSSLDVNYVADILQKCLQVDNLNQSTVQDVLDIVVEISGSPDEVLDVAQRGGNGINRLLHCVDRLGQKLNREDLSKSGPQRLVSGGLAVEVWDLTQNAGTAPVIGLQLLSDGSTSKIREKDLISLTSEKTLTYGNTDVAILLSRDFIQGNIAKADKGSDVRLAMNVYKDTKLFERHTVVSNSNLTLNSKVIAAQLLVNGQPIRNLGKSQVKTVFLPVRKFKTELRRNLTVCAYWDFSANQGRGDWADDGCGYLTTEEGKDICVCDHLTNFAVLVSYYDQESLANDHQLALSIITIVGLSLSIAGLSLSILSFLFIKKLHKGRTQQTLFQLSLALLMSWIVFLAGVHQTDSHAGCIAVAALLHYLIMASFMWMLMEGILQYLLFVKVINTYFSGYMLKTSLLAWGLPILPVVIILGINTELYKGGEEYCWMSLDAFYYGFAIPVGLIILTNIIIFILVVISLCRRKEISKHSTQSTSQTVVNIRASFICFCVLGLSWVFGFLAIEDARIVFQYIFCIFASLQGFIIFVMMTARDKQVRKYWISIFCRWGGRTASSKSGTGSNSGQNLIHRPRVGLTSDTDSKCEKINSPNNSTTFTDDGFAVDPDSSGNFHSRQPAYETGTCGSEV